MNQFKQESKDIKLDMNLFSEDIDIWKLPLESFAWKQLSHKNLFGYVIGFYYMTNVVIKPYYITEHNFYVTIDSQQIIPTAVFIHQ